MPARENPLLGRVMGDQQAFVADDMERVIVSDTDFTEVASVQGGKVEKYLPGYGVENRQGEVGYADFDAEATGNAGGSNGERIDGIFRFVVYEDPSKEVVKRFGPTMRTEDLRTSVAEDRTNKRMVAARKFGTPDDGFLALEFKADGGSDGYELETYRSQHSGTLLEQGFPFSKVRTRG